ncbi:uncharacterized protein ACRADG_000135 [Cochliomyia hominivorax]
MANYKVMITNENVKWPAYVSTVELEDEKHLEKARNVLEKALVTLEAYEGPSYNICNLKSAHRTGLFLYEILASLTDSQNQLWECKAMILNEPWMKANSIAMASFEFLHNQNGIECPQQKLVMKRKKSLKYYKDTEMVYDKKDEELEDIQFELVTDV